MTTSTALEVKQVNVQKEQLTNLARELSSMRQDINGLRLADAQYESQTAEVSRHVREMGVQLRKEVRSHDARFDEVVSFCKNAVEQLSSKADFHDLDVLTDRVKKIAGQCDNSTTNMRQFEYAQEESMRTTERMKIFHDELAAEVQQLRSSLESQMREMHLEVNKAINAHGADMKATMEAHISEYCSHKESMTELSTRLAREGSVRHAGLEEYIKKVVEQEKAAREQLISDCSSEIKDNLETLRDMVTRRSDVTTMVETSAHDVSSSIQDLISIERALREKDQVSLEERISEVEQRVAEEMAHTMKEHSFRLAESKEGLLDYAAKNERALEKVVFDCKAEVHSLGKLRNDISDNKALIEAMQEHLKDIVAEERQDREHVNKDLVQRISEVERQQHTVASEFTSFYEKSATCSMLEELAQRLRTEQQQLHDDFGFKHDQLESTVKEAAVSVKRIADDVNKERQLYNMISDESRGMHREITDMTRQMNDEHQALKKMQEIYREQFVSLEQRSRDTATSLVTALDEKVSSCASSLVAVEKKLKEQLAEDSGHHSDRITEIHRQLTSFVTEHTEHVAEIREMLHKHSSQHKTHVEERVDTLTVALRDAEAKLRHEMSTLSEQLHTAASEYVVTEREARKEHFLSFYSRIEDLDRTVRDVMSQLTDIRQDCSEATLGIMLRGLETKLRDEWTSFEDETSHRFSDFGDQFQKGLRECGSRTAELKELVVKAFSEEKMLREKHEDTVMQEAIRSMEHVEVRLRQEIVAASERHLSSLRETLLQESKAREQSQRLLENQIADTEKRVRSEVSQFEDRTTGAKAQLREMVVNACEQERVHLQTLLNKEQEYRSAQLDTFGKVLEQEKARRNNYEEDMHKYVTETQQVQTQALTKYGTELQRMQYEMKTHTHDLENSNDHAAAPSISTMRPQISHAVHRSHSPMAARHASPQRPGGSLTASLVRAVR